MTLVNARAAFEKAITDSVNDSDPRVKLIYDNIPQTLPGKTITYVVISITFNQATVQAHGAAATFYSGAVQCNIYVPKNKGTSVLSAVGESVISGLTSINASDYTDTFSCKPRVGEISGPIPIDVEDRSHFLGIVSYAFSANS